MAPTAGAPQAYDDALGLREEVALASKVCKSLIGAAVRKAYRAQGRPFWDEWKADDDIYKAVRGAFVAMRVPPPHELAGCTSFESGRLPATVP